MDELNLKPEQQVSIVEEYRFEPIKGYPMLNWKGKRPFNSTIYYPAQLKETHGQEVNGWLNMIFWGDNLQVMSHLLKKYRGQIDLVYIDPPFDSKADYKKKISLRKAALSSDSNVFEEKQYTDIWSNDEYLQFMYERILLLRELLSPNGVICLHCDWHKSHLLRMILDEIFGANNIVNEIAWCYSRPSISAQKHFTRVHDTIWVYSKNKGNHTFNADEVRIDYSERTKDRNKYAAGGSKYAGGTNERQVNELGKIPEDYWYIPIPPGNSNEILGYPTQKPIALLERIIKAFSNKNEVVFDCFMGSGTTQDVAMKLGRKFIGADINLGAIQTTTKRLLNIANDLKSRIQDETRYIGFSVYNVNHYDIFRNPLEAKDILMKALEI